MGKLLDIFPIICISYNYKEKNLGATLNKTEGIGMETERPRKSEEAFSKKKKSEEAQVFVKLIN